MRISTYKTRLLLLFEVVVLSLLLLEFIRVDALQLRRKTTEGNSDEDTSREDEGIIGGEVKDTFQYPWFTIFGGDKACGGVLISKNRVLTTANCIRTQGTPDTVIVMTNTTMNGYETNVLCSVTHPDFEVQSSPFSLRNDLAVLYLDKFTISVQLPQLNSNNTNPGTNGQRLTTIGFETDFLEALRGKGSYDRMDDKLMMLETSFRTFDACQANYPDGVIYEFEHMCTRVTDQTNDGPAGACDGDQGNPIMGGGNFVIGLQSFTYGCAGEFYNVGVNIATYINWIIDRTRDIDCDTTGAPTPAPEPDDCILPGLGGLREKMLSPLQDVRNRVTGVIQTFRDRQQSSQEDP